MKWKHLLFVCAVSVVTSVEAIDLNGKVIAVSGDIATLELEGDVLPSIGNKVNIFFKLGDTDVSVGSGKISEATSGSIKARIDQTTGSIANDQLVRVRLGVGTQTKSAAKPSAESNPLKAKPADEEKLLLGHERTVARDYDGAIQFYTEAINLNARNAAAFDARGGAFASKQDYESAIHDWETAITLDPARKQTLEPMISDATRLKEKENSSPTYLGVLMDIDPEKRGARVMQVMAKSPAAAAGFRKGDLIVLVDSSPVSSPDEVSAAVSMLSPRTQHIFTITRDGKLEKLQATLSARPADFFELTSEPDK